MSKKNLRNIEEYCADAIENISDDRSKADLLLTDLMIYLKRNTERHEKMGTVAAKYLETMQRSNEQLVKLIALMKKDPDDEVKELSDVDKEDIYDELQEEKK